ncbi:MAG TPA: MauE/DoxX family redox-associated membrane protein [Opitutaceae bacterium]
MDTASKHLKVDPVCGMNIPDTSVYRTTRNGETYFFCSEACRQTFVHHPSEYLIPSRHDRSMPVEDSPSMAPKSNATTTHDHSSSANTQTSDWSEYIPLFVLIDVCLIAATAQEFTSPFGWRGMDWMTLFMGWFLTFFAALKFFDLSAFADGFQRYDLLAKHSRTYALIYPLIELALAVGYLTRFHLVITASVTAGVMLFGSIGVLRILIRGEKMKCACMGGVLNVPLSRVALLEDVGMAGMALAMLSLHR